MKDLVGGDLMIMVRLRLPLEEDEYAALLKVATNDLRSPADEVRFILRQDFERRGLLDTDGLETPSANVSSEIRDGTNQRQ